MSESLFANLKTRFHEMGPRMEHEGLGYRVWVLATFGPETLENIVFFFALFDVVLGGPPYKRSKTSFTSQPGPGEDLV